MQGRDQQRRTGASGVLGGNAWQCPGGAGGAEVQTHLALKEMASLAPEGGWATARQEEVGTTASHREDKWRRVERRHTGRSRGGGAPGGGETGRARGEGVASGDVKAASGRRSTVPHAAVRTPLRRRDLSAGPLWQCVVDGCGRRDPGNDHGHRPSYEGWAGHPEEGKTVGRGGWSDQGDGGGWRSAWREGRCG